MQGLHSQPTSKPKPPKVSDTNKKQSKQYSSADEDDDNNDSIKSKSPTPNQIPKICLYCRKFPVAFECKNLDCVELVRRRYLCVGCDRNLHQALSTKDHKRTPVSHTPPPKRKSTKPEAASPTPKKKHKNPYVSTTDEEDDNEIRTEVPKNPPHSPSQFGPESRSRSPSPISKSDKHGTFSSSSPLHAPKDVFI